MTNELLEKIRPLAEYGVSSEAETVYLMVELRKLVEHQNAKDQLAEFVMFADWVVHPQLDRTNGGSQALLIAAMDDFLEGSESGAYKYASLEQLHTALEQALIKFDLPTDICRNEDLLGSFLAHFSNIIRDCPVKVKTITRTRRLRAIQLAGVFYLPKPLGPTVFLEWQLETKTNDFINAVLFFHTTTMVSKP